MVMFLPGEAFFFSAAVECDTTLLEEGMRSTNYVKVIPASRKTARGCALLRAVAYGWRQRGVSLINAKEIGDLLAESFTKGCGLLSAISLR